MIPTLDDTVEHRIFVAMSTIACTCGWSTSFGWSAEMQRAGAARAQEHLAWACVGECSGDRSGA